MRTADDTEDAENAEVEKLRSLSQMDDRDGMDASESNLLFLRVFCVFRGNLHRRFQDNKRAAERVSLITSFLP